MPPCATPLFALGFFGTPILCLLVLLALVLPAGRGIGGLVAACGRRSSTSPSRSS